MNRQDEILTAYCGLYCGDCIRYQSKAADLAHELSLELKNIQFDEYAKVKSRQKKEIEYYQECIALLDEIIQLKCTTPCRLGGDGSVEKCEIKKCVLSKGFQGCWECTMFEQCDKFESLEPFCGDAPQKNLVKIKEHGLDRWANYREKFYPWLKKLQDFAYDKSMQMDFLLVPTV